MSHSQVLKVSAVVLVLFGVPLLLAPNALVEMYKASAMNGVGIYNSMLYGAALVGLGVINWSSSRLDASEVRGVVLGNLVGNTLGFLAALSRQLVDPAIPAAAWLNVVIFLVFAALFGQLYLRSRGAVGMLAGHAPPAA